MHQVRHGCRRRARGCIAWGLALVAVVLSLHAQTQVGKAPHYDVATIKPVEKGPVSIVGIQNQPNGLQASNVPVVEMVRYAYGSKRLPSEDRVLGAPEWAKTQWYNIDAKMSEEDAAALATLSKEDQSARREQMLQALLVERMGLKAHIEQRQMAVYDLVVNKGGPKLKPSTPEDEIKMPTGKGMKGSVMLFTGGKVRAQKYSMSAFADFLSGRMAGIGRPVIDKTGMAGTYSFELSLQVASLPNVAVKMPTPSEDTPSIFTALQDELGLKLVPSTAMLDVVVIDHVERPSEN